MYTRVYFSLLGGVYMSGIYVFVRGVILSSVYVHRLLCPRTIVFSCVGLALPLRTLLVASLCALRTRVRRAVLHDSYPNHAVASP